MLKHVKRHHDFMWTYLQALAFSFARPALIFLIFFASTVFFVSAYAFYLIESPTNPNVPTYFEALYFTVSTMTTVGFGDITPMTKAGRILAMFLMIGGTGLYVSFTALIASSLMEIEVQMKDKSRSHKEKEQ